jgi:hypothetical protein
MKELPAGFPAQLSDALARIRVGDYKNAAKILGRLRAYVPKDAVELHELRREDGYFRLRLATLLSELTEHAGKYDTMNAFLSPYEGVVLELQEQQKTKEGLVFKEGDPNQKLLRQKLYYLWQKSVWCYRTGDITRSGEYLNCALDLARSMRPISRALLTQLYYGAGKLAFHECEDKRAIAMYQDSLMSASLRLDIARKKDAEEPGKGVMSHEAEAAQYSVAKILALGLGQCLREQSRLKEAQTQVLAGRLLLSIGADRELSHYALLLLGSIERSIAGEDRPDILDHAYDKVEACAKHFKNHPGEVGNRARLELALVTMQKGDSAAASEMLTAMLTPNPDPKWAAEVNIGLSRAARREMRYADAVTYAQRAFDATRNHSLERIKRRAHTVLVLALYEYAVDGGAHKDRLNETLREIEWALAPSWSSDVRTRANMLLTKARVLNAKGEVANALAVLEQYKAIREFVEVGRIHELARTVEDELKPMELFRSLADAEVAVFNIKKNEKAVRNYLVEKAGRTFNTPEEQAKALDIGVSTLYLYRKQAKLPRR